MANALNSRIRMTGKCVCRNLFPLLVLVFSLARGAEVRADTDTARYRGEISAENNQRFFARVAKWPVRRLIIDSPGGEVEAGIALGYWVFRHGIDVIVEDRCLSSCANYVFPAGRRKFIRKGAFVAWHGNYHHLRATGLWRDDVAARMAGTGETAATAERHVRRQVQHLVALERDFFHRIGVDQRLCWVGKMPPHSAPGYYTLSASDMARYGLKSVHTPLGYPGTVPHRFDDAMVLVRLESPPRR
jgi:hypothetical protein